MRKTTPEDGPEILEMLTDYFIENQHIMPMNIKLDIKNCRQFLETALGHGDLISFIADDGVIMGDLAQTWFGPNRVARGALWYVRPRARNGLLARRLLNAFDDEAKERGAIYSKQDLDNPAHLRLIERFVGHCGYREFSKSFLKEF